MPRTTFLYSFAVGVGIIMILNHASTLIQKVQNQYNQNALNILQLVPNSSTNDAMIKNFFENNQSMIIKKLNFVMSNYTTNNVHGPFWQQTINFQSPNLTTYEITVYKLKQVINKYWFPQQKHNKTQIMIKVFDLTKYSLQEIKNKYIKLVKQSLNYLKIYETGSLFWLEVQENKWKTLKKRSFNNSNLFIFSPILIHPDIKLKDALQIYKSIKLQEPSIVPSPQGK